MADYLNPRMSIIRPTPNAKSRQQNGNPRSQQQEEDSFMTLSDSEIAGCISDIGINFSVQDLQKPQPQQIQKVFEWFAELLMNTSRDVVAPAMKSAADDVAGQYSDIFSADTRDLMGFFASLRRMLAECGIHDFTFNDLYRPTRERLVRIFSYVINFIRFRESQTEVIDEHFNKTEKTKQRIEALYAETRAKEDKLTELERNRKNAEAALAERDARFRELKNILQQLQAEQVPLSEQLERMKEEQKRRKKALEDKTAQVLTTRHESAKLRPYTEQSPAALEAALKDLNATLNADRSQVETLERRARAVQTSADSFAAVTSDVQTCVALLQDVQRDLAAEETTLSAAQRNRDALSERSNNVRDVERQERQLQKHLENVQAKTDKLRIKADERREAEAKRMEELRKVNEQLKRERAESGREMERRRVRIEQTEKKMADLKENIENEVHGAQAEFVEMDSHVRSYISQMEQSIG